jgi:mRNA-degrading endonuclease RelE of RelBE toxin-antitoxin system
MPQGYTVYIENSAATAIRQLERGDQVDVCQRISALAVRPRPPGGIRMTNFSNVYRVRIAGFGVAYIVDDAACAITVTRIGDRKDVFR